MRDRAVLLTTLALFLGAGPVGATRIAGRAAGGPPPIETRTVDLYGKFRRNDAPADQAAPNPLIVAFRPKSGPAPSAPPETRAVMDQRNEQFTPRALAVQAGTTVDFVNSDDFYHNVFSLSTLQKFNLGRYRKGVAKSVRFEKPGLIKLFCEIHPRMIGYILVLDTPWIASATPAGDFVLPEVPPGSYDVLLWHERLKEPITLQSFDVAIAGEQRLDFTVPATP